MPESKATKFDAITTDDPASQQITAFMDGTTGVIRAGSHGKNGELQLLPHTIVDEQPPYPVTGPTPISAAQATIHLRASDAHVRIGGGAASPGLVTAVDTGQNGKVTLQNAGGHGMIVLDANEGDAWLGGGDAQHASFHYDASAGTLRIGAGATPTSTAGFIGGAKDGAVRLENADGKSRVHLTAKDGTIVVNDDKGKPQITLDGDTGDLTLEGGDIHVKGDGDITVGGGDCAEDFDFVEAKEIDPGTVVVIDEGGALRESTKPYDRKVAGVCSGAGLFKPGLVLGRDRRAAHRHPVALVGKVYCKVDASEAPIEIGDLLTTSATPGHAMKASDPGSAFGAVIGKAMQPLASGRGLLPILIALQ